MAEFINFSRGWDYVLRHSKYLKERKERAAREDAELREEIRALTTEERNELKQWVKEMEQAFR